MVIKSCRVSHKRAHEASRHSGGHDDLPIEPSRYIWSVDRQEHKMPVNLQLFAIAETSTSAPAPAVLPLHGSA
jgi:hypothetical protein